MNNHLKEIEIPKKLDQKIVAGVRMHKVKRRNKKPFLFVAAAFVLMIICGYALKSIQTTDPSDSSLKSDMIATFYYEGNRYVMSDSPTSSTTLNELKDAYLGKTKGGIDEFGTVDEDNFTSTGAGDTVYTMEGYNKEYRLLLESQDGQTLIFENAKEPIAFIHALKLKNNVNKVAYRNYSDWDHARDVYHTVSLNEAVTNFVNELEHAASIERTIDDTTYDEFRKEGSFKEFTLYMKDGTVNQFILFKNGLIHYPNSDYYYKVSQKEFKAFWKMLK